MEKDGRMCNVTSTLRPYSPAVRRRQRLVDAPDKPKQVPVTGSTRFCRATLEMRQAAQQWVVAAGCRPIRSTGLGLRVAL
jgi:hypothetical protein